jgi:hypothetical protein
MPTKTWIEVPIDQEIESVPEDGYAPFFFPPEGADLLFHFTEESFLRVLSALINGAALTYPDTWLQVVWDFLQNVEYPVDLCEKIAECIASNEDTQAVIRAFVTNDESIRDWAEEIAGIAVLTAQQLGQNILKPGACDPGYTFNQASKFVFLLNQLSEDLFEAIEVGTNALERASLLISAIPAIGGLLPFDEALTLADSLVENVEEDYAGNYDQGLYDDLRCGLWCKFKDSCDLSIDDALAFYEEKLSTSLPQNPADTLQAIAQFILIGDIPGDFTVYAIHTLIIAAMRAGQEMFGINFAQLGIRITAAGDDIDNDWETICEECPAEVWCYFQDTTETVEFMDLVYTDAGYPYETAFTPSVGIEGARTGFLDEDIPKIVLPDMRVITGFSFDIDVTGDVTDVEAYLFFDGVFVDSAGVVAGPQTVYFEIPDGIPAEYIMFGVDRTGLDRSPVGAITAWQALGEGDNPFGEDNCEE